MNLELLVDAGFDPLEDQPIGVLNLVIRLEVIDRSLIHPDSPGIAEVQEFVTYELGAIISNNVIRDSEPMDNVLDELGHPF